MWLGPFPVSKAPAWCAKAGQIMGRGGGGGRVSVPLRGRSRTIVGMKEVVSTVYKYPYLHKYATRTTKDSSGTEKHFGEN